MEKEPAKKSKAKKPVASIKVKPTATPKMLRDVAGHLGLKPQEVAANVVKVAGRIGESRTSLIAYLWQAIRHKRKLPMGWEKRKTR